MAEIGRFHFISFLKLTYYSITILTFQDFPIMIYCCSHNFLDHYMVCLIPRYNGKQSYDMIRPRFHLAISITRGSFLILIISFHGAASHSRLNQLICYHCDQVQASRRKLKKMLISSLNTEKSEISENSRVKVNSCHVYE